MNKTALCIASMLVLSGCGSVSMPSMPSLWPFGERDLERSRIPPNSTTYVCEGGKRFYVRTLDNGAAAWVILPEREFRLEKDAAAAGMTYGNGKAVLVLQGEGATLTDGPTVTYAGCKIPSAEPAAKK